MTTANRRFDGLVFIIAGLQPPHPLQRILNLPVQLCGESYHRLDAAAANGRMPGVLAEVRFPMPAAGVWPAHSRLGNELCSAISQLHPVLRRFSKRATEPGDRGMSVRGMLAIPLTLIPLTRRSWQPVRLPAQDRHRQCGRIARRERGFGGDVQLSARPAREPHGHHSRLQGRHRPEPRR